MKGKSVPQGWPFLIFVDFTIYVVSKKCLQVVLMISKFGSSRFGFETNGYHKDSPKGILLIHLQFLGF
jgi:hypothetical protein